MPYSIDPVVVFGALILVLTGCIFFGFYFSIRAELWHSRKKISRFPLFAIRDRLVLMIADGTMEEGNYAWRSAYVAVNNMLDLNPTYDLWQVCVRFVRLNKRLSGDATERARFDEFVQIIKDEREKNPQYDQVVKDLDTEFGRMIWTRTKVRHFIAGILFLLSLLVIALMATRIRRSVTAVRQALVIKRQERVVVFGSESVSA